MKDLPFSSLTRPRSLFFTVIIHRISSKSIRRNINRFRNACSTCFFSYESKRFGRLGVLRRLYCKFFKKDFCLSLELGRFADLNNDSRWVFNQIPGSCWRYSVKNGESCRGQARNIRAWKPARSYVSKNQLSGLNRFSGTRQRNVAACEIYELWLCFYIFQYLTVFSPGPWQELVRRDRQRGKSVKSFRPRRPSTKMTIRKKFNTYVRIFFFLTADVFWRSY